MSYVVCYLHGLIFFGLEFCIWQLSMEGSATVLNFRISKDFGLGVIR